MNKLKRPMILAALACAMTAGAAEYPWLTFRMSDGSEISVAAEGLSLSYADGQLLLKSATVDRTLAAELVNSMRFTTAAAAVDGITAYPTAEADYFDLSGRKAGRFSSSDEARKVLPSGTYVVKTNDKTIKLIF